MATQIILLERVDNLGNMGDIVDVKPGYARNFLLPQKKALRASKENIAYFEAQKKSLAADNDKKKKEAEKLAKVLEGLKAPLIRQASEGGQLYGSVNARDIAAAVSETAKGEVTVTRDMVKLNDNIKTIGLFNIAITLHPEVKVDVTINIARSPEEAEIQDKTGRALIADSQEAVEAIEEAAAAAEAAPKKEKKAKKAAKAEEAEAAEEDAA